MGWWDKARNLLGTKSAILLVDMILLDILDY